MVHCIYQAKIRGSYNALVPKVVDNPALSTVKV